MAVISDDLRAALRTINQTDLDAFVKGSDEASSGDVAITRRETSGRWIECTNGHLTVPLISYRVSGSDTYMMRGRGSFIVFSINGDTRAIFGSNFIDPYHEAWLNGVYLDKLTLGNSIELMIENSTRESEILVFNAAVFDEYNLLRLEATPV